MARFIFVTGGVVSSLGKGLSSASLAYLLQSRGYKVRLRKLDPYLNVDPGTMSPFQHGEVFVTDDVGARSPLDIIVNPKLQIIKIVAITAVALVIKLPAVLENIRFSCETPIPRAPPSDFCIRTNNTKIIANMMFSISKIFSMRINYRFFLLYQ